jgi:3-phenylpropionate/trans-cinnamate dioxygenase ferredoxin reductase subunit
MLGIDVTLIDPAQVPLERVLGLTVGGIYRDLHAAHGVKMLLGNGVEAFEGSAAVERVLTSDGRALECDLVVVGVGVEPRTRLAVEAGLAVDDGILVDEHLQTALPGVFAAGDVARAHHPFYGAPVRVEHWANARHQGPLAAMTMLGGDDVYDRLPHFSSQQYDARMAYVGLAHSWDRVVFRGDPAGGGLVAFWLLENKVVAGMSVNGDDDADGLERLIRGRTAVDDRRLADADTPLDELVPAVTS